tara:strand:+ start:85 stop:510 length:426 start_codon:yes stop_codon:yes gene_type:complete
MSSQLNVDTIVDKAGSGGTNVKVANTSTYISDGGSATQNTVQGLLKAWVRIDGDASGASIDDSFNCAGITDNGTGDYSVTRTNNMSSADTYYVIEGQYINSVNTNGTDWSGTTTATVQYKVFDTSATDRDPVGYAVIGDLA